MITTGMNRRGGRPFLRSYDVIRWVVSGGGSTVAKMTRERLPNAVRQLPQTGETISVHVREDDLIRARATANTVARRMGFEVITGWERHHKPHQVYGNKGKAVMPCGELNIHER